jgi:hypothetical protein
LVFDSQGRNLNRGLLAMAYRATGKIRLDVQKMLYGAAYIYILTCATDHNMYQCIIVFLKLYGIKSNYIP